MNDKADTALRLLIVDDSVEDAEAIVSALRNDGVAVRPLRPADLEQLGEMVATQHIDVVVAAHRATGIPLQDVTVAVSSSDKDIPVVALADDIDGAMAAESYASGVRRIGIRDEPAQLLRAIKLEWDDLRTRRKLRRLDAQVRETERRCDALIESSRDPIAYVHEGMHIRANAAYLDMFGFDAFEDVEGMSLLDLVSPTHVDGFKQLLKSLARGEPAPSRYELEARDADGQSFSAVMEFTQAMYEGEPCQQVVIRRQDHDTELAREVEALRQRDQVTGLLNRQAFLRAVEEAVADAAGNRNHHGLLLIEPDNYQRLLSGTGIGLADDIVVALAKRLEQVLGEDANTLIARFAEHTLAVLLRKSDHVSTRAVAERLRHDFDGIIEIGQHSSATSVSIGGVQIGERIADVTQVLEKAHQGLQSSSAVGGNRIEIFDPSSTDRAEHERVKAWVQRLRQALDNGSFVLHHQPVVSLRGEPGATYETLLRMVSESGEPVSPAQFLPIAEEHGLLGEIDAWVVRQAIRVLGERERSGRPVTLMTKVSQASLSDATYVSQVRAWLAEHGVPGERLVLLLSEARVFGHLQEAQAFGKQIAELGCQLALEHYGAGLDSSQLLAHLDPGFVKLDGSLTRELAGNADHQEKVKAIAQGCSQSGIRTIASFVEDPATMSVLFSSGIDYVQGEFLSPAVPQMDYEFT